MHDSQRIGSAVPIKKDSTGSRTNREAEKQYGLLMLFNCIIKTSDERKSVAEVLGSQAPYWPQWLSEVEMIERRELAVPLIAGLSSSQRSANVLVVQLMHVCSDQSAQNASRCTSELCNSANKDDRASIQFHKSSVTMVTTNEVSAPFQSWPPNAFWGIHHLSALSDNMHWAITEALRTAAFALQNEITTHKSKTKGANNKDYERDSERANECLKHVQLFRLNSSKDPMATRLATCPLQLGYADMDQWKQSGDCCGRTSGITSLADVLPERCRCGLICLKRRNVGKDVITPPVPEKEWVGVLTHQLKEQALQRFLRGQVFMKACGTLLIDGHKTQHSMVFLDEYPEKTTTRNCRSASLVFHMLRTHGEEQSIAMSTSTG